MCFCSLLFFYLQLVSWIWSQTVWLVDVWWLSGCGVIVHWSISTPHHGSPEPGFSRTCFFFQCVRNNEMITSNKRKIKRNNRKIEMDCPRMNETVWARGRHFSTDWNERRLAFAFYRASKPSPSPSQQKESLLCCLAEVTSARHKDTARATGEPTRTSSQHWETPKTNGSHKSCRLSCSYDTASPWGVFRFFFFKKEK